MTDPTIRSQVCDPVSREIIVGVLGALQNEMGALLERTALSPIIREKKDYWTAVYDAEGRMVAGTVLPLFGKVLEPILAHYPLAQMRPGDVYWYNDCYASQGAVTHLPDQLLIAPVFDGDRLCGFLQSWAHLSDIGGIHPGSLSPHSVSLFQEGIVVPPVKLAAGGVVNEEILRVFARNTRDPVLTRGDMRALMAALKLGERRFHELLGRFTVPVVLDAFAQIQDRTEKRVRKKFEERFAPGVYEFTDFVEADGHGGGPFPISVRLEYEAGRVVVDLTASADQASGPINYIMHPVVASLILTIYLSSDDAREPLNDGMMRLVDEVRLRPGSILQPTYPAPLAHRSMTWLRLQSAFMGLINVASGGKAMASSPVYTFAHLRGSLPEGRGDFLLFDGVGVGYGARPFADGIDGVYYVAQENYPAEFLNSSYPVRVTRYSLNPDTGGPGRWRGGCGIVRELEVHADDVMLSIRIDNVRKTPWGVDGGRNGRAGRAIVNPGRPDQRELAPLSDGTMLRRGDVLRIETGGGGGHGHPFDRPPASVRLDVMRGLVSLERAREDYGVALVRRGADVSLDEAGTARLRTDR